MSEKMNIYESIAYAIGLVESVGKDHENLIQKWKFRSIDDVYNAVNKALKEAKVCIQASYSIITDEVTTTKDQYGKEKTQHNVVLKGDYTLFAVDGSNITVTTFGKKLDYGDKGFNAAMSTAYKYMMFQTFCIPTEDEKDPDFELNTHIKPTQKMQQSNGLINEAQAKRLFAVAKGKTDVLKSIVEKHGFKASKEITVKAYETIVKEIAEAVKGDD